MCQVLQFRIRIFPIVHTELRRLAHRYMKGERGNHTLQTTALINEVYMRLLDCSRVDWQDRTHFFAVTAQMMERILVNYARSHRHPKRWCRLQRVPLKENQLKSNRGDYDLKILDDALKRLALIRGV